LNKDHRLAPYERWFASSVLRRRTHPMQSTMLERVWGPNGARLYIAGVANGVIGTVLIFAGIIVLNALGSIHAISPVAAYCLVAVGVMMTLFAFVRLIQARRAGREFLNADKPRDPWT